MTTYLMVAFIAGCGGQSAVEPTKATPPAKVAKLPGESDLVAITLTAEAEKRLAITLSTVERKPVSRTRSYGGEVTLPPGRSVTLSAPVTGSVEPHAAAKIPFVGATVKTGQPLFVLLPLFPPEREILNAAERVQLAEAKASLESSRVEAEGQAERATVQHQAAKVALERAEQLVRDKAGSVRTLDEAKATFDEARAALKAAQARRDLLINITLDADAGKLHPVPLTAPLDGVVRHVHAVQGQLVTAGAPLIELANFTQLWIRVPVYDGDLAHIDSGKAARLRDVSSPPDQARDSWQEAKPVAAPPSADALAATVDLYFDVENSKGQLRPGQRVEVLLPLRSKETSLVVPWSAVVFDIHGGAWVYENTAPHTFIRRRVQVRHVADGLAVLADTEGPKPGAKVVAAGAAELFGTEFGFGK